MTAVARLRDDEEFTIKAVAEKFSGTWKLGENPPDAHLAIGANTIAVEITTLTQYVTNGREPRPRASDDAPITYLANELNLKLHNLIPDRHSIGLVLTTPISNVRKTATDLAHCLCHSDIQSFSSAKEMQIQGNTIKVQLYCHEELQKQKVWIVATNRNSDPNILANAMYILKERIVRKTKTCRTLVGKQPLWLALLNDYFLADTSTYERALSCISVVHPFDKILLISRGAQVDPLFER